MRIPNKFFIMEKILFFDFEIEYSESFQKDISFFRTKLSNKVIKITNHNESFNYYACNFLQNIFLNQDMKSNMHIILDEYFDSLPVKINSKKIFLELYNAFNIFNNYMINNDYIIIETESGHIVYTNNLIIGFLNNIIIIKSLLSFEHILIMSGDKFLTKINNNYCKIFFNNKQSSSIAIASGPTFKNIISSNINNNNIKITD